jgi:DNA-directed RNA polymerase specialized sigma24 family protein
MAAKDDDLRDVRKRIDSVLAAEDEVVSEAWQLRYLHEKSYAEISRELGVPVGTLGTWFRRIKERARNA